MRVTFRKPSTGIAYFPGLAKPVVIDTEALSQEEAVELEQLVEAARFFAQSAATDADTIKGAADYQQYGITVETDDKRRTMQLTDPLAEAPAMRALIRFLEQKARELAKRGM